MERSIDVRMAAHTAAAQRRASGRPTWDRTIRLGDVFHHPDLTFPERRDAIVARVRESGWPGENDHLAELVDDLAETQAADEFDDIWNEVYNEADVDRVWIDTTSR